MTFNSRCLSTELSNEVVFLEDFMTGKVPPYYIVKFITTSARIVSDNLNYCNYKPLVADVEEFCATDN